MRIDDLVVALQKRRMEKQAQVFQTPPQNHEEFVKQLGIWMGLGEALSVIEDARKKDEDE